MKRGTSSHPKIPKLAEALGCQKFGAVGILCCLWDWAAQYCPDGNIGRFGNAAIVEAAGWRGDPAKLVEALVSTRWADRVGDKILIHDWPRHCEDSVHKHLARSGEMFADGSTPSMNRLTRDERSKAEALYASKKRTADARKTPGGRPKDAPTLAHTHALAETLAIPSQATCTEPEVPASMPETEVEEAEALGSQPATVLVFPVIHQKGKPNTWPLNHAQVEDWQAVYTGVDVESECRRALAWIGANKMKTGGGMLRFLNAWLARAQDSGKGRRIDTDDSQERLTPEEWNTAGVTPPDVVEAIAEDMGWK